MELVKFGLMRNNKKGTKNYHNFKLRITHIGLNNLNQGTAVLAVPFVV